MKNKRNRIIMMISVIVIIAILVIAKVTDAQLNSFWALVPPVIAIALALITKEAYSSLFIGILFGAVLYSDFSFTGTVDTVVGSGLIESASGIMGIMVFLVLLGIVVSLMNKAGGSAAFGKWAAEHVKSRVGVMLATFLLGALIFVDDYFNCLVVGSVMRPVTDNKKISRAKLTYIIDATAAPICMIAPVSSWAAAVSAYTTGTEYSGIELFIRAIPYNFYSIFTIVFVIALILMKMDYGPMRLHEANAILKGDLYTCGDKNETESGSVSVKGKVIDLVIPIVVLVICCVAGLLYVGGFGKDGVDIVTAFSETDATVGLPWGGLIALIIVMVYFLARKVVSFKESMECIPNGFIAMVPAILILTLATGLKNITSLMGANEFVTQIVTEYAGNFSMFLPAIIFIIAAFISFSTGTSWGTFGILIPIVISIFEPGSTLMLLGMSACLAGSVCGDHCSPISDTTIMSSAGGQCNHINHVSTQLPYSLTVAAISFAMYLMAGLICLAGGESLVWITLPVGIIITVATLFLIKIRTKQNEK